MTQGVAFPAILAGQYMTAANLTPYELTAWKTGTTSRASVTSATADPDLVIALPANTTWRIQGEIFYTGDVTGSGGLALLVAAPSGSSGVYGMIGYGSGGSLVFGIGTASFGTGHAFDTNSTTVELVRISGTVFVSGTAGNLSVNWAQSSSDATATVLQAGCTLTARRLA